MQNKIRRDHFYCRLTAINKSQFPQHLIMLWTKWRYRRACCTAHTSFVVFLMQLNSAFSLGFLTPLSGLQQRGGLLTVGRVVIPSDYISERSPTHLWPVTKGSTEYLLWANYWAQTMKMVQTWPSMSVIFITEDWVPGPGTLCGREPRSRPHSPLLLPAKKNQPNLLQATVPGLMVTQNVTDDLEHYRTLPSPCSCAGADLTVPLKAEWRDVQVSAGQIFICSFNEAPGMWIIFQWWKTRSSTLCC